MKNLPDRFPIRYAIIVNDHRKDSETENYFDEVTYNILWDKFVTLLQNEPLTLDNLFLPYQSVIYNFKKNQLSQISELKPAKDWAENLEKKLMESIKEGEFTIRNGVGFELGLYSYQGTYNTPLFWQMYINREDDKVMGEKLGLYFWGGLYNHKKFGEEIYRQYEQIMKGNINIYEKLRTSSNSDVFNLTIPNSNLWTALDQHQNDGFIPTGAEEYEIDETQIKKSGLKNRPKKISVVVARSLAALFHEEMLALYRVSAFCNNCGKALPFGHSKKYCPDTLENKDCVRERNRKRAKKHSQKSL